jgi:nicotinate-nucleotide adenylyltransferase
MDPDKKKTGLFFGSFNPIHTGHLVIAQHLLQEAGLQEVWFVVSPQNPLKPGYDFLPGQQRLEMVALAVAGNEAFRACDIEMHMPVPSYTVHTLEKLRVTYPDRAFALIIGSDNLAVFDQWKDPERILEMVDVLVYPRPGSGAEPPLPPGKVVRVDAPLLEVSSTMVRDRIRKGLLPRYLVPDAVLEKIVRQGYYR